MIQFYFAGELLKETYEDSFEFCIGEKVQIEGQIYIIYDIIYNLDFNRKEYYLALS